MHKWPNTENTSQSPLFIPKFLETPSIDNHCAFFGCLSRKQPRNIFLSRNPLSLRKTPQKNVHNSLPFDSQSERRTGNPSRDFQLCSGGSFQVHNHCALLTFCEGVSFFLPFSSDFFFWIPSLLLQLFDRPRDNRNLFLFLKMDLKRKIWRNVTLLKTHRLWGLAQLLLLQTSEIYTIL